jgi:putative endonuclease
VLCSSAEGSAVKYVYLLESVSHRGKRYVGVTQDLKKRLLQHNAGKSAYTNQFKPWRLVVAIRFDDDQRADAFEKYLKSGSGHAFATHHFW